MRLCLAYEQFIVQWGEQSRSSPAGSRSVPGVWGDGKSSQAARYLLNTTLFVPTLVLGCRGGWRSSYPKNSTRLQDWQGCASHPICVYADHWKPVPFMEHFIAEGVWLNMCSINMLLVLAVLEQILPWLPTDFTPFSCLKIHKGKRPEARHPQAAVSCNQPWKTIHQSPSFITSQLTKLLCALILLVVQVCSQQRWRTWGTETGCCDTILKERLKITLWICRK